MKKAGKVLSVFLPFLLSMALMYVVSFSAAVCYGILSMKDQGLEAAAALEQSAGAYVIWATAGVHLTYIIVFSIWFLKVRAGSCMEREPEKLKLQDYAMLFLLGVAAQIAVSMALNLILPFFPQIQQSYEELYESMELGKGVLPFVTTSVLAPVAEELIYRGVTMALVSDSAPFAVLNVMQALLFGIYHMNVVQFSYAFVLGLLLGLVYKRYHNLKACIALHASINLCANIFSFWG